LCGAWLNQFRKKLKRQALAGASAFCWAIWLSRNDVVFDKSSAKTFMQVMFQWVNVLILGSIVFFLHKCFA
jgi:hypothetical protein